MTGHIIHVHETMTAVPEEVWEVITDVERADQVLRSVTDSHLVDAADPPGEQPETFGVGTVWREKRTVFGHHGEEELRVVECEPPRRLLVETRLGRDVVRTAYSLTPTGANGEVTRLAMTTTVEMSGRTPVGNLAWQFFGGFSYEATRKMLVRDLEDIATEVARRSARHDRV